MPKNFTPTTIFEGDHLEARTALANNHLTTVDPDLTYTAIQEQYALHEWGIHHAQQPLRYEASYGTGNRDNMLSVLGRDAHPLGHLKHTHDLVVSLARATLDRPGTLDITDPRELVVARASSLVHDCGECTHSDIEQLCGRTIGDMVSGTKTTADRAKEYEILGTVLDTVYPNLPEDFRQELQDTSTHRTDRPGYHLLEGAHVWGFYEMARRVGLFTLSQRDILETPARTPLELERRREISLYGQLASEVSSAALAKVEKHIAEFPILEQRLEIAAPIQKKIEAHLGI